MNCCKRWEYYLREKLFSFYQNDFAANTLTVPQSVLREKLRWIWSQLSTIVLRYWVSLFSKDQSDALPQACLPWGWPVTLWKASWVLCSPGEKIKRSHPCWSVYSPVDTWGLSSVLCSVNLIREATGIAHRSAVFAFSKSEREMSEYAVPREFNLGNKPAIIYSGCNNKKHCVSVSHLAEQ